MTRTSHAPASTVAPLLATLILAACASPVHTSDVQPGGPRDDGARAALAARSTSPPAPPEPTPLAATVKASPTLALVVDSSPRSWFGLVGPWIVHAGPAGRRVWSAAGRWEAQDLLSTLPSFDVAGVWPDHLFASVYEPFQQVREWDGKSWRAVAGLPAVDLQPWIGGTVIGRAGSGAQSLTQAFLVYGRSAGRAAYVPRPSPDPKKLCPHYLKIDGFTATPGGDLVLWGPPCTPFERPCDRYGLERFGPDGAGRSVAFEHPSLITFSESINGRPPVAAARPDSVWTIGIGRDERWLLAHWNGTRVDWEATPFGGWSTFGATLAEAPAGTLWLSFGGRYVDDEPLRRIAQVWSRAPRGEWPRWEVHPATEEGRPIHPRYLRVVVGAGRVWFDAGSWEESLPAWRNALWSTPP